VLNVKLPKLPEWTRQRQEVGRLYDQYLADISDLVLPAVAEGATHVYHLYVVRTKQRDALQQYLAEQNIGTLIHYPVPPHLQQAYSHLGIPAGSYPIAEEIANTSLSLPMWPGMTEAHVSEVSSAIKKFFINK